MLAFAEGVTMFQDHPDLIERFCRHLRPELIEQVLQATGKTTVRHRKLPNEQVVWLVIGMSMYNNCALDKTLDRLKLNINGHVVSSSICDARKRLGAEPMAVLFDILAKAWTEPTDKSLWRGLRLLGIDGTCINVPDSDKNLAHFGKPGSPNGEAAYPQARVVTVMDF